MDDFTPSSVTHIKQRRQRLPKSKPACNRGHTPRTELAKYVSKHARDGSGEEDHPRQEFDDLPAELEMGGNGRSNASYCLGYSTSPFDEEVGRDEDEVAGSFALSPRYFIEALGHEPSTTVDPASEEPEKQSAKGNSTTEHLEPSHLSYIHGFIDSTPKSRYEITSLVGFESRPVGNVVLVGGRRAGRFAITGYIVSRGRGGDRGFERSGEGCGGGGHDAERQCAVIKGKARLQGRDEARMT